MLSRNLLSLVGFLLWSQLAPVHGLEYTPPSEIQNSTTPLQNSTQVPSLEWIDFVHETYQNWGHGIKVPDPLLVAYPKTTDETVSIVNWARKSGRKVRPRGYRHSFPPLTVTMDTDPSKVVLLDLTRHLTNLEMTSVPPEQTLKNQSLRAVKAQTGAAWEELMLFCEKNNVGLLHSIIIGDASVGGVLAIGAHGAVVPAKGENPVDGFSYGSLSNLILAFKAVVWDEATDAYLERSFSRSHPDSGAFLAHVGRSILTEVTLLVGPNYNLRCESFTDIPADELFARPEDASNSTRTLASFLDKTGRADVQWYQFTKNPWLKLWDIQPEKPEAANCLEVSSPYNYQFPVNVKLASKSVPELGEIAYNNLVKGLDSTKASDIWGPSKNILLYSNGSSQSIVYGGFVILTERAKLQSVLSTMVTFYKELNQEYANRSEYPIEYYIKFRATGLDNPAESLIKGVGKTVLSPLSIPEEYPNLDTALWMNTFTSRENPLGNQFMRRFESFAFATFKGGNGLARSEWSKSWAYTDDGGPFSNEAMLKEGIPRSYGAGWKWAVGVLDKYDPERLFSNQFLDGLFQSS